MEAQLEKPMDIVEIQTQTALVKSRIPGLDYVVNPYIGCAHGCRYCYACFMTRHSHGHANSRWGDFVEVKVNIADVLKRELSRKRRCGTVMMSSVCDPYQPAEIRYRLSRRCIEALNDFGWTIEILTRSPLVARDIDLIVRAQKVSVGFSIPTDREDVRRLTEPNAPSIPSRIATLQKLKEAGIRSWVFIAPMLPMNPEKLYAAVAPYVDEVLIDALNQRSRARIQAFFRKHGWQEALTDEYAERIASELISLFGEKARKCKV